MSAVIFSETDAIEEIRALKSEVLRLNHALGNERSALALHVEISASLNDKLGVEREKNSAFNALLLTAKDFADHYLQDELEEPELCFDEAHHNMVCALFSAIEKAEAA